ncbi:MAG: hypothetical protein HYZ08_01465 [Candidatus Kerfeldbacteria bacterium]|nr:hypothetical protein [Candidatus Kerfeldbacteria bacterium]
MGRTRESKFHTFRRWIRALIILGLLGFFVWISLITGIWQSNPLSPFFYTPPQPIRVVEPTGNPDDIAVELRLSGDARVSLDESELTMLVRSEPRFPLRNANIVLQNNRMQVFGSLPWLPHVYVTSELTPSVTEESLDLQFQSIRIGGLSLPWFFHDGVAWILETLITKIIQPIGTFEHLQISDKTLTITVQL